jgi:putative transcriptional regulator
MTRRSRRRERPAVRIQRALDHAVTIARGEAAPDSYRATRFRPVDVKRIRTAIGLTQAEFAARYWISIDTLRKWEAGRVPDGPARAYLAVIEHDSEAVHKALRARVLTDAAP